MSVVNTNVSASLAQSALMRNERALGSAMEQLSTGSKINSASDDAAGLAMASKFTSQIKGLDMAVKNANDGVSMISTAEGALNEVTNMLQRMRELAVQSSNGTMTQEDRNYMDKEYKALDAEIDRIEKNTQWNSTNILDGSVGSSGKVDFQISSNYAAASGGKSELKHNDIIGSKEKFAAVTAATVLAADGNGDPTGKISDLETALKGADGTAVNITAVEGGGAVTDDTVLVADKTYTFQDAEGNTGTIKLDQNSTSVKFAATDKYNHSEHGIVTLATGGVEAAVTATSSSVITVDFGNLGTDTATLGDVLTQTKAQSAIGTLDTAIKNVNEQRATFGAASNRLVHSVDNMTNIRVNAEASRSRIEDTDYAKTTSELAKAQIIAQAGTAMLAQANQSSQSVLSLLR